MQGGASPDCRSAALNWDRRPGIRASGPDHTYSGITDVRPQSAHRKYRIGSDSDRPMMRAPATPHLGHRTAGGGRFAIVEPPRDLDATGRVLGLLTTVELPFTLQFYYVTRVCVIQGVFWAKFARLAAVTLRNRPLAALATRPPEGRPDALPGVAQGRIVGQQHRHGLGAAPAQQRPIHVRKGAPGHREVNRPTLLIAWRAGGQQRAQHLDVVVERRHLQRAGAFRARGAIGAPRQQAAARRRPA